MANHFDTRKSGKSAGRKIPGLKVSMVLPDSAAWRAGLRKNDIITRINGAVIGDELDFYFNSATDELEVEVFRRRGSGLLHIERESGEPLEIDFYPPPIRRCANRCIFCFIDQLPRGMRKNLYIKDEDCRHSFLNGNYVTLSSMSKREFDRLTLMKLSPLYISIHATDHTVRGKMLGNLRIPDIMEQLGRLRRNGIEFHTQIVVCPGINDGKVLEKTVKDLLRFKKGTLSIAVVPVGLTRYRTIHLEPVTEDVAQKVCDTISWIGDYDVARNGVRRVFLADEFFIKAGRTIPNTGYYRDFPQIENGVGLIRTLLDQWKSARRKIKQNLKNSNCNRAVKKSVSSVCVVTSVSAFAFVNRIIGEIGSFYPETQLTTIAITNKFFGNLVTVAGLLTGSDISREVRNMGKRFSAVIVPHVIFNYRGYTLDGFSLKRMEKSIKMPLYMAEGVDGLLSIINGLSK